MLPAHFTAVSMWVEALRLLPKQPREDRIAFCNGLGTGYCITATTATVTGFYLAARLPPLMSAALLFLTPLAFLMSTLRNSRMLVDRLALGARPRARAAVCLLADRARPDVERHRGRHRGLSGASLSRGAAMSALVGRIRRLSGADPGGLPAERGVALARRHLRARARRGLRDRRVGEGGRDRDPRRRDRQAHDLRARRARDRADAGAARARSRSASWRSC